MFGGKGLRCSVNDVFIIYRSWARGIPTPPPLRGPPPPTNGGAAGTNTYGSMSMGQGVHNMSLRSGKDLSLETKSLCHIVLVMLHLTPCT